MKLYRYGVFTRPQEGFRFRFIPTSIPFSFHIVFKQFSCQHRVNGRPIRNDFVPFQHNALSSAAFSFLLFSLSDIHCFCQCWDKRKEERRTLQKRMDLVHDTDDFTAKYRIVNNILKKVINRKTDKMVKNANKLNRFNATL